MTLKPSVILSIAGLLAAGLVLYLINSGTFQTDQPDLVKKEAQTAPTESSVSEVDIDTSVPEKQTEPAPEADLPSDAGEPAPEADLASDAGEPAVKADETLDNQQVPTFDIVRIEPTGDATLAGRSSPNAVVIIKSNGLEIARTTATAQGEWVVVLDQRLAAGANDIAIVSESDTGSIESAQRIAVAINADRSSEPLVAISEPGKAVEIVQKSEEGSTELAQADAKTPEAFENVAQEQDEGSTNDTTDIQSSGDSDELDASKQAPSKSESTEVAEADNAEVTGSESTEVAEADNAEVTGSESTEVAEADNAKVTGSESTEVAEADNAEVTGSESTEVAEANSEVVVDNNETATSSDANQESFAPEPEKPKTEAKIEISDIQSTGDHISISGKTTPATSVRVLLEGQEKLVTSGIDGRWRVSTLRPDAAGTYQIRVEQLEDGQVLAAVEKDFERQPDPKVEISSVETVGNTVIVQGTSIANAKIRMTFDKQALETAADADGSWRFDTERPVTSGQYSVTVEQLKSEGGVAAVLSRNYQREPDPFVKIGAVQELDDYMTASGTALPQAAVKFLTGAGQEVATTADDNGIWQVQFDKPKKTGEHQVIARVVDPAGVLIAEARETVERKIRPLISAGPARVNGDQLQLAGTGEPV